MINQQNEKFFECKSKYVDVQNESMFYLEQGEGDPILFIHGMPTSSYLWRNILPHLAAYGKCIAVDLIGMGQSSKPNIDYRVFDHIEYLEKFIQQLNLQNITLVLHGWGSVIGFDYARRHVDNVKALVFYESHVRPVIDWDMLSLPVQQFASMLSNRTASYQAVVDRNYLIKKLLPSGVIRKLTVDELQEYERPFMEVKSRKPLWQYILDLPLGDGPQDVLDLIQSYSNWLQHSKIPKLMLYAIPGFITTINTVEWVRNHCQNVSIVCLEDALHFAQESIPDQFSEVIITWYQEIERTIQCE